MSGIDTRKIHDSVRILLLQFRGDEVIQEKEYNSFIKHLGLSGEQLVSHDVLTTPLTNDVLFGFDALVVGGNGSESSNDDTPYRESVMALLRFAYEQNLPTFAVCYGAQFAAIALGGTVERVEEMREVGTYRLYLTDAAKDDLLFCNLQNTFNGQMGHNDSITILPDGVVRLAYSDRVPNQAFRFRGKPFYAVQFHPELDSEEIRFRFNYYKDYYSHDMEEFQRILNNIQESTDAALLLTRFVDRIVLPSFKKKKE